jgi:SAM-dependent methyltransferase
MERRRLAPLGENRLLDFGCGGGSFLERMAKQGWKVTGLDASPEAVRRVREELGLTALLGSLPHPELPPRSFDVVTMWHSLEHVHQPLEVLRAAHDLLTPGGRILVAVPNIQGWPAAWFGRSWFGLDLPRHLTHFTPTTLQAMLTKASLLVHSVRMIRHSDWLRSSAKLARRQGRLSPLGHLLTLKPAAKLAAWACYAAGQSDCMLAVAERPA